MKFLIIYFAAILFANNTYSQKESAITGLWNVLSVFDGKAYINLQTDSFSLTPQTQKKYPDPEDRKYLKWTLKSVYLSNHFEFSNGHKYKHSNFSFIIEGEYKIDQLKKTITVTTNTKGKKEILNMKYQLAGDLLYLTMPVKEKIVKFVLTKKSIS